MKEIVNALSQALAQGQAAVAVTILASTGSVPRGAGARMLVLEDGRMLGTVGGGAVEYQSQKMALQVLADQKSKIQDFTLTRSQAADIGMVCGGNVKLYFQYIPKGDEDCLALCRELEEACRQREKGWLVLDITKESCWKMEILRDLNQGLPRRPALWQREGRLCYSEPLSQRGRVCIFGGGHVAQELVPVLDHVGFDCIVFDDRQEFANPQIFPQARKTIVGDLKNIGAYLEIQPEDYVCIMTRGHEYDYYVQKQVMPLHPCYIGIMGSRKKIQVVTEKLLDDGFSLEEIQACHMPIGTEIQAETPAEIAISIAGELILTRARISKS